MPEDIAIISSKSDIDPRSHGRETGRNRPPKKCGQTDRQTAFQLYIVHRRLASVPALSCRAQAM